MTIQLEVLEQGEQLEQVASVLHGKIGVRLARYLDAYVEEQQLGHVFGPDTDLDIPGMGKRRADVGFVALEKMPAPIDDALPFAPDLVVEIISRIDDWSEIVNKANLYLQCGVRLVWVVDPYGKGVFVFRPQQPKQLLNLSDELDGENVVPGFKLPVSKLLKLR